MKINKRKQLQYNNSSTFTRISSFNENIIGNDHFPCCWRNVLINKQKKISSPLRKSRGNDHVFEDEILYRAISIQSLGSFPCVRNTEKREGVSKAPFVLCTSRMIDERYAEVDSLSKGERLKVNRGRGVLFPPFFFRITANILA